MPVFLRARLGVCLFFVYLFARLHSLCRLPTCMPAFVWCLDLGVAIYLNFWLPHPLLTISFSLFPSIYSLRSSLPPVPSSLPPLPTFKFPASSLSLPPSLCNCPYRLSPSELLSLSRSTNRWGSWPLSTTSSLPAATIWPQTIPISAPCPPPVPPRLPSAPQTASPPPGPRRRPVAPARA